MKPHSKTLRPALMLGAAATALMALTGSALAQARTVITVDEEMVRRPDARALIVTQLTEGTVAPPPQIVAVPQPQQPVSAPTGPSETALLFPVQFAFDSAELNREAMEVLDIIASAILSDPMLREARFLVEGHADASGGWEYNKNLSERRARSVSEYLVSRGLRTTQLISVGFSWNRLIPGLPPRDARHRRVEIGRLG